jgi:hypothetical protein
MVRPMQMQKVAAYRAFAKEFRVLAASESPGEDRDKLLAIARDWEGMARRLELLFSRSAPGDALYFPEGSGQPFL